MPTPKKKRAESPSEKPAIETVSTHDLVRSVRRDLDAEGEKRRLYWEAKQEKKKSK
jgi:hypothetical protein